MPTKTIEKRVNDLEIAMTSLSLLPARVTSLDTQIVRLRDETRAGFSAVRSDVGDVRGEVDGLRGELGDVRGQLDGLREEGGGLRHELHAEESGLCDEVNGLRAEFRTGPDRMATWSETRAVYEDLIERIKLLGEGIRAAISGSSVAVPVPALAQSTIESPARRRSPRKRR